MPSLLAFAGFQKSAAMMALMKTRIVIVVVVVVVVVAVVVVCCRRRGCHCQQSVSAVPAAVAGAPVPCQWVWEEQGSP